MFHIIKRSPWQCNISEILKIMTIDDDLLLIQDGVFGAIKNTRFIEKFIQTSVTIFVLKNDVDARGITNQISSKVRIIDYVYFVNLFLKHTTQISW